MWVRNGWKITRVTSDSVECISGVCIMYCVMDHVVRWNVGQNMQNVCNMLDLVCRVVGYVLNTSRYNPWQICSFERNLDFLGRIQPCHNYHTNTSNSQIHIDGRVLIGILV